MMNDRAICNHNTICGMFAASIPFNPDQSSEKSEHKHCLLGYIYKIKRKFSTLSKTRKKFAKASNVV